MKMIFLILGIVLGFMSFFALYELWNAPEGYEDKKGFHFGKRK